MNFLDIIGMSVGNLWRRKLRTFLTVLGVMIGTASIVSMLALAFGMKEAQMKNLESCGNIKNITVSSNGDTSKMENCITDDKLEDFSSLPHVKAVEPQLYVDLTLKQNGYTAWAGLTGVSDNYLKQIELGEGELPTAGSKLNAIVGNTIITNFSKPSANGDMGYYDTGELPNVDLMNRPVRAVFQVNVDTGKKDDEGNSIQESKDVNMILGISGISKGNVDTYTEYSNGCYVRIDDLKKFLKKTFKKQCVPGQPTDSKGKPYKKWTYNQVVVTCDDVDNVTDLTKTITDMGYYAQSNKEWLDEVEKTSKITELVLGGIGLVALIVAAIGIANTMMMSTYERTKEIGVMKVLGCDMRNIRSMFLSEAAFIGIIGGVVGTAFSYIISYLINKFAAPMMELGEDISISLIPLWLPLAAVVFSAMVGMLAGFFPARRAMKLSALSAIRTE